MQHIYTGRVRVGVIYSSSVVLNACIKNFTKTFPQAQLSIFYSHSILELVEQINANNLDFAVTYKPDNIPQIFMLCGKTQYEIKQVMIVGGTRLGCKTASLLEKQYHVKLIDKDREKCLALADKLHSTLVINGDGRDLSLLHEEGIKNTDVFISLTNSSETNILSCLLAKKMGVKKSVAEVENIDYMDLAENIGIGTLINTKLIAASYIYRYTLNVDVKHLKFVAISEAEVFEVVAEAGSRVTRKTLAEVGFPTNANVGGIIRDGQAIIAKGNVQIMPGDNVVIFALPQVAKKVLKLFQG